jgi:hypothetical protein
MHAPPSPAAHAPPDTTARRPHLSRTPLPAGAGSKIGNVCRFAPGGLTARFKSNRPPGATDPDETCRRVARPADDLVLWQPVVREAQVSQRFFPSVLRSGRCSRALSSVMTRVACRRRRRFQDQKPAWKPAGNAEGQLAPNGGVPVILCERPLAIPAGDRTAAG